MSPRIRVTLLVTALITVLVVSMGLFFGVMPQRENAAAAQTQREAAEAQNALLQSQLEQLAEDSEALTERREQFARQLQAFPEENQYASYIDALDAIAEEQNVDYRAMETGEKLVFDLEMSPWQGEGSGEFGDLADDGEPGTGADVPAAPEGEGDPAMPEDGIGPGPGDPFSGRELVAVPITIEVAGGATGIRHFVRLVQTGDRYTTLTSLQFEAYGEEDEEAPPIGDEDGGNAEPASFSVSPLPLSLIPMTQQPDQPVPEDPSEPEDQPAQPDEDEDPPAQEDEEELEGDDEDEEDTGGGSESDATLDSGPDVLFGETTARIEGYIWILRQTDGESSVSPAEEQLDSTAPADEGAEAEEDSEESFDVSL
ncbi:hypothetical protein [Nesterenkonia populi]